MTREETYDKVNKCETLLELANVIRSLTDEGGNIKGRTRLFDGERMAKACENFKYSSPNNLTREFGIRQQAMYINYYESL
jgi:hypothetical protein